MEGFVVVRLLDMDEKMLEFDLSVDGDRLEREFDRIEERSSIRHDVLRLCCIVKIYCILLLGAQWPIMARGPGAMAAVEGKLNGGECGQRNFFSGEQSEHGPAVVVKRSRVGILQCRYLASFYDSNNSLIDSRNICF